MSDGDARPAKAHLRLIGRFRLTNATGAAIESPGRRARALLAFLALDPEHAATRERLSGLLWSDRGETQARASLRQCLLEWRNVMGPASLDLMEVGRETIALRPEALSTDVDHLRETLLEGPGAMADALRALGDAHLLDDLEVPGLFNDWRDQARSRFERTVVSAVEATLGEREARGDWAAVRELAEAYLARDRVNEAVAACAIRADMALGATGAAHRQFRGLEAALQSELAVRPGAAAREALNPPAAVAIAAAGEPVVPAAPPDPPRPAKPSIAILPLKNLSGDSDQEYFADAITEEVVYALSRWRSLFVIAHGSSATYKNRDVSPERICRELGVRYLVTGSIRRSGLRVRAVVHLLDGETGGYAWSERFERQIEDVLDLQDDLTENVAAAIEPAVLASEGARSGAKSLKDYDALDCYYRGMWWLHRVSREGYQKALALFEESVRRDPELGLGRIGLSRILWGGAIFGWSGDPQDALARSAAEAQRALDLDPDDALAHFACAGPALYLGDHGGALIHAESSVRINPNFALAAVRLGHVLVYVGRASEAIEPIERGIRLSPADPQLRVNLNLLAVALYHCRRYEEAAARAREALKLNRERRSYVLAASLARLGRYEEASEALPREDPKSNAVHRPMSAAYARREDLQHWREGVQLAAALPRLARQP